MNEPTNLAQDQNYGTIQAFVVRDETDSSTLTSSMESDTLVHLGEDCTINGVDYKSGDKVILLAYRTYTFSENTPLAIS